MPSLPLSDQDIASALTYVYSSFGNSGKRVTAQDVQAARALKDDVKPIVDSNVAASRPAPRSEFE